MPQTHSSRSILHLRSDNVMYFANAEYTTDHMLERLSEQNTAVKFLLLDLQAVTYIDMTGIDALQALQEEIGAKKNQLALMGVHIPVMHVFKTSGFYDKLDQDLVIENRGDAIKILFKKLDHSYCKNTCPYALFHECPTVKQAAFCEMAEDLKKGEKMFKEEREELRFDWSMIGNIGEGRPNLGSTMNVSVYRLMQFTLRDVLIKQFDVETADKIFYEAGKHAGREFCKELITSKDNFNEFVVELQELLKKLKIGISRVEKSDLENMNFTLAVAEDLDCSGLPVSDETICTYDEGFISGLLSEYTGKSFGAEEVDCWCSGDRVCRYEAKSIDS